MQKGTPAVGMDSSSTTSPSTVSSWHVQASELLLELPMNALAGNALSVMTTSARYRLSAASPMCLPFENSIAAENAASLQCHAMLSAACIPANNIGGLTGHAVQQTFSTMSLRIRPVLLPLLLEARLFISRKKVYVSKATSFNSCHIPVTEPPDNELPQGSVQDIQSL